MSSCVCLSTCLAGVWLPWLVSRGCWHGCRGDGTGGRKPCDILDRPFQPGDAHHRSGCLWLQAELMSSFVVNALMCKQAVFRITSRTLLLGTICPPRTSLEGLVQLSKPFYTRFAVTTGGCQAQMAPCFSLLSPALCGSEEQKQKYLPKLASLDWVACWVRAATAHDLVAGRNLEHRPHGCLTLLNDLNGVSSSCFP